MHTETKRRLRARAEAIGRLATHILSNYDGDEDVATAVKFSWLLLRGPRSLHSRWGADDLEIDLERLRAFLWQHHESLGFHSSALLPEESEILTWHNEQAALIAFGKSGANNVVALQSRGVQRV